MLSQNHSAKIVCLEAPEANENTRYKVCYGTDSGCLFYSTAPTPDTEIQVPSLAPGIKYYAVVKTGSEGSGWSEDSNEEWVIPYVEMQVPGDYSTIQAAVNAAPSNGAAKIYVASGYYGTGSTITINKGVHIIGAGYSNTTIDDQVKFYYAPMPILTESGQIVTTGIDNVSIWGQGNCAFAWFSDYVVFYRVKFWSWDYQQSYVVGLDVWDSDTRIDKSLFVGNGLLFWGADPNVDYSSFQQAPDYAIQLYAGAEIDWLWDSNIFTSNAGYIYGSSSVPYIDGYRTQLNYWGTTDMNYIQSKMDVYNGINIFASSIRSSPVPDAYPKPVPEGVERLDIVGLRQEQNALKTRVEVRSDSAALLLPKVVRIYQLLGEYDLAHRYLMDMQIGHADNQPLVLRSRILEVGNEIRRRRPLEALKKADALIKEYPEAPVARQMLLTKGVIYMSDPEAGNPKKAREAFEEALATCSDELLAKNIRRYLAMTADSKDAPVEKKRREIELSCSPNPANPSTMIRFQLCQADRVNLSIYNTLGQKINVLVNGEMTPGPYSVIWDGKDATGRELASGVYFVRLEAGEKVEAKKMLLLR
ncbi:MAG: FlgD immunoglobulin-like domain containing protein [Candidatus Latescibacterota bacterium]